MRTPSPFNAARDHTPPASLTRADANPRGAFQCIDFSAPMPGEPSYGDCSHVCRDLELGILRSISPGPTNQQSAYVPPSEALMLFEPNRVAAAVAPTPSAEPTEGRNHRQAACLIFLGLLAGASVGCGVYFGAIRPHQH